MDRFHEMAVFVAVAEEEGFAAGARRLRLSPPAVTRAVAALEARLGARLLDRTTRHVRVTDAGARYLEDARRILSEVDAADEAIAGVTSEPRGRLVVTAPVMFGCVYVTPGIVAYLERYPETTVEALLVDRVVNLVEEGVDVAVRIGHLPDSSLHARRVGEVRRVCCASPGYLARAGVPAQPEALAGHAIIESRAGFGDQTWRFDTAGGARTIRVRPRLTVTSNDAAVTAAVRGFGITRLLSYQVNAELAAGRLKTVLEAHEPPPLPVHLVHHQGRFAAARVRAFVDLLAERLGAELAAFRTLARD